MGEIFLLGLALGVGAGFSVGPIFVTIVHEAVTRGFWSSFRVILGSAVADLIVVVPALSFSWIIVRVEQAHLWVGLVGAAFFLYLSFEAARNTRRMWTGMDAELKPVGWAFWKGVIGNLANPLSWTFWLITGTPTMLRSYELAGESGLLLFTATWFLVATGVEVVIALVAMQSQRLLNAKGLAFFNGLASITFLSLAVITLNNSLYA